MRSLPLGERLWLVVLDLSASVMALVGMALLLAALPLLAGSSSAFSKTIVLSVLRLGAPLFLCGLGARYLAHSRRPLLVHERVAVVETPSRVGGWLIPLAAFLVALPIALLSRSAPLLALWERLLELARQGNVWQEITNASSYGGLLLLPLAAVIFLPAMQSLATVFPAVSSTILLVLLTRRSPGFPRLFLIFVLLEAGLVLSSFVAVDLASRTRSVILREMKTSGFIEQGQRETEVLAKESQAYLAATRASAGALGWTLLGYAVWMPLFFFHPRARTTFAVSARAERRQGTSTVDWPHPS